MNMTRPFHKRMLKPVVTKAGPHTGQPFTVTFQISRFVFDRKTNRGVRP